MDTIKSLAVLLSILTVILGAVLSVAGGADGLWEHEGVVNVSAPPDRTFEYLTDPKLRTEWILGLETSEASPAGWLKPGSTLTEQLVTDGERRTRVLEVTEYEAGSVFAYRTSEDGVEIEMRYVTSVFQTGRKTKVDYTCSAQYPGFGAKVLEPILGHRRLSGLKANFERLSEQAATGK